MILEGENDFVYKYSEEDIQDDALYYIGRKLTEDEITTFIDRLSDAIGDNMLYILPAILEEFKNNKN